MAKPKSVYSCTECGGQALKWQGQCPHCQQWNTLVETVAEAAPTSNRFSLIAETGKLQRLSEIEAREEARLFCDDLAAGHRMTGDDRLVA